MKEFKAQLWKLRSWVFLHFDTQIVRGNCFAFPIVGLPTSVYYARMYVQRLDESR